MKKLALFMLIAAFAAGFGQGSSAANSPKTGAADSRTRVLGTATESTGTKTKWSLAWSDEFNDPGTPNPTKWIMEHGMPRFDNEQMFRNDSLRNCRIENGHLVLEAHHERIANPYYVPGSNDPRKARPYADYTSCNIFTREAFRYGRYEIRAKVPSGWGMHTGIWLWNNHDILQNILPNYNPGVESTSEIDILETIGNKEPNNAYTTFHWREHNRPGVLRNSTHVVNNIPEFHDKYHIFAMEWTPAYVKIWIDNVLVKMLDINAINAGNSHQYFRTDMLFLLTLQISNQDGWAGPPRPESYPAKMEVDYVRVYQQTGNGGITSDPSDDDAKETADTASDPVTSTTSGNLTAPATTAPATISRKAQLTVSRKRACAVYGRNYEAREVEINGKKILRCFPREAK